MLKGPGETNWDPAEALRVMASILAKCPQIGDVLSDYGQGSMGLLRAFQAAGCPITLAPSQDANKLSCFPMANKDPKQDFNLTAVTMQTLMMWTAMLKALSEAPDLASFAINLMLVESSKLWVAGIAAVVVGAVFLTLPSQLVLSVGGYVFTRICILLAASRRGVMPRR